MIEEALSFIPPHDRELWVRVGMSLCSELGDDGFDVWDRWSQQSDNYNKHDARAVWRSIKPYGGITIGTLYAEAKRNGWTQEGVIQSSHKPDSAALAIRRMAEQQEQEERHAKAAQKATELLKAAQPDYHPYLESKGFPGMTGLVLDGVLLVPMRCVQNKQVVGLQTITEDGVKKFLPGTRARLATFCVGGGVETFLCEGYATALSVREALRALYLQAFVVVTFSAANLAAVAERHRRKAFIVADNDESGTGERYAAKTRFPYWMPPDVGTDANDFHQAHGVRALADAINGLRRAT